MLGKLSKQLAKILALNWNFAVTAKFTQGLKSTSRPLAIAAALGLAAGRARLERHCWDTGARESPWCPAELESPWLREGGAAGRAHSGITQWPTLRQHPEHCTEKLQFSPFLSYFFTTGVVFLIYICVYIYVYTCMYTSPGLLQASLSPAPSAQPMACLAKGEGTHLCPTVHWRQTQLGQSWLLLADWLLYFLLYLQPLCLPWVNCTENWAHAVINRTEHSTFPQENAAPAGLQFHGYLGCIQETDGFSRYRFTSRAFLHKGSLLWCLQRARFYKIFFIQITMWF